MAIRDKMRANAERSSSRENVQAVLGPDDKSMVRLDLLVDPSSFGTRSCRCRHRGRILVFRSGRFV